MLFGTMAAIGLGTQLISGLFGAGADIFRGRKQAKQAADIQAKNKFPTYKRPKESLTALSLAEQGYYSPQFAGRGYLEEQVGANTAQGIRAINEMGGSPNEQLAALASLYSNQQEGYQQIGMEGVNQQNQALSTLLQQLGAQAGYSDQEFEWNKAIPYERAAQASSALTGASMANKDLGINRLTNTLGSLGYGLFRSGGEPLKTDGEVKDVLGGFGQPSSAGGKSLDGLTSDTEGLFGLDTRGMNEADLLQIYQLLGFLPTK